MLIRPLSCICPPCSTALRRAFPGGLVRRLECEYANLRIAVEHLLRVGKPTEVFRTVRYDPQILVGRIRPVVVKVIDNALDQAGDDLLPSTRAAALLCKAHASFESAATARCLREAVDAARGRGSRTRSRGAWRCVRLRGTVIDPTIKGPYGITAGSARCRRSRPGNLHLGPLRGLQRSMMQGERPFNGLTIACSNPCSSNRS
jgi:hypothetical protein